MPNNDPKLHQYQDDLDTKKTDDIIREETDDPTKEFGVPPEEFKDELDKIGRGDIERDQEDMRDEK